MSLKSLNTMSDRLVRASGKIDVMIHNHLVAIAVHINGEGNGDVSAANYLFSKITSMSGLRKQAIGNWLSEFAGCSWNADKKQFGRKKGFVFVLQSAEENPWFKYTAQPEFKPVDGLALVKAAIKKMENALADEEHAAEHKIDKGLLRSLKALVEDKPAAYVGEDLTSHVAPATVEEVAAPAIH